MILTTFAITLLLLPVNSSGKIPVGTVIPVMLDSGLNAAKDKPDERIEGRIMQEIPLPSGSKIRQGARIFGHTVSASTSSSGSSVVLKFNSIQYEGRMIRLTTGLLALASMALVNDAQLPVSVNSETVPDTQWVTRQVGGHSPERMGKGAFIDRRRGQVGWGILGSHKADAKRLSGLQRWAGLRRRTSRLDIFQRSVRHIWSVGYKNCELGYGQAIW